MSILILLLMFVSGRVWGKDTLPQACQPDLSTACLQGVAPSTPTWQLDMQKTQTQWDACREDVDTHCEGIQVGSDRLDACLKAHQTQLSPACKKAQGL